MSFSKPVMSDSDVSRFHALVFNLSKSNMKTIDFQQWLSSFRSLINKLDPQLLTVYYILLTDDEMANQNLVRPAYLQEPTLGPAGGFAATPHGTALYQEALMRYNRQKFALDIAKEVAIASLGNTAHQLRNVNTAHDDNHIYDYVDAAQRAHGLLSSADVDGLKATVHLPLQRGSLSDHIVKLSLDFALLDSIQQGISPSDKYALIRDLFNQQPSLAPFVHDFLRENPLQPQRTYEAITAYVILMVTAIGTKHAFSGHIDADPTPAAAAHAAAPAAAQVAVVLTRKQLEDEVADLKKQLAAAKPKTVRLTKHYCWECGYCFHSTKKCGKVQRMPIGTLSPAQEAALNHHKINGIGAEGCSTVQRGYQKHVC